MEFKPCNLERARDEAEQISGKDNPDSNDYSLANNMIEEENEILPSSAGSLADLKAEVNIAKVLGGYFSSSEVAKSFVDLGIGNIEENLPRDIKYGDFGGGQGFLTKMIVEFLKSRGHNVNAVVIDANDKFLEVAQKEGLATYKGSLEYCHFEDANLITMRAVNHYNSLEKQLEILKNVFKSLAEGGFLVSQISSGCEANCRLRSDIVNLKSLGRAGSGESYHWTSVEEYNELLQKVGFRDNKVAGYAPDYHWSPEEQWNRFHDKETKEAIETNDQDSITRIEQARKKFVENSYDLINQYLNQYSKEELGLDFNNDGTVIIRYKYPIIISRKDLAAKKQNP